MKIIVILSGKGGVGKSSISSSLAISFSKEKKIICADCDVDASNLSLVFGAIKNEEWKDLSTNQEAVFDLRKCNSCKKCLESCYFNAINWKNNKPCLNEFSCEGCGYCELLCPEGAITLKSINNAKIGYSITDYGFNVVSAQLNIGQSGSGKVVSEVKKMAVNISNNADIMVVDSAAGIGCPVIASVAGSDYAIVVTEPTPSGLSDMKRAINIVSHFKIRFGIIINKFDINNEYSDRIKEYADKNSIEIIAKIPYDKNFSYALNEMKPIIEYDKTYGKLFVEIKNKIIKEMNL